MQNQANVGAVTAAHIFRGIIMTGSRRLSDTLNDQLSEYVTLRDVQVHRLTTPEEAIYTLPSAYLKKEHLRLVAILNEEINAPTERIYAYVERAQRFGVLFVDDFEVEGTIYLSGKDDAPGPLLREGDRFIPVTGATLRSAANPRVRIRAPTILVNHLALAGFHYEGGS